MLTEFEIETMLELPEVRKAVLNLKKDFIRKEAPMLEISDHDFFALIMMAPTVGMALANGSVSLFEEIALNKKARSLSKGGYFMKKDPVVHAMKFFIKKYDSWSYQFLDVLKMAIQHTFNFQFPTKSDDEDSVTYEEYRKELMNAPYILVRLIATFFLANDDDIMNRKRTIGRNEYLQLIKIGEQLGLDQAPVFQMFCKTFDQKA